jgi:hypothetical protein
MAPIDTDAAATPAIRAEALHAAEEAFHRVLVERGVYLDFPGRLEAMEEAMDECYGALAQPEPVQ